MENNTTTLFDENFDPKYIVPVYFYLLLLLITFPFYRHVYQKNRERDKISAVFHVIDCFYNILKKVYFLLYFYAVFLFLGLVSLSSSNALMVISGISMAIIVYALYLITQTNYLMLSLLAIQRFTIYFHPQSEKYLKFNEKTVKYIFWSTIVYFIGELMVTWGSIAYIFYNLFLLLSAILYIPIGISIQKYSHLQSAQVNRPQRYVLWQLIAVILLKFMYTVGFHFCLDANLTDIVFISKICDAVAFPLIIQTSYLGCNRRNLYTLFATFKLKNCCGKVCCCWKTGVRVDVERSLSDQRV
ncbi:hypothetical protein CAEBREN_09444 [Caenorhabditis brenneri]|uniref:Serpentine Receptor, class Z n=1 Tax=Caenorhabditis brenneri TaxID=135651 RepID=G0N337_CAEBE|nr:hypothetical protein CAEBREN_09444 [Caenorhabditis brenneri]